MKKLLLAILASTSIASYAGDWPAALDDCDIIFKIEECHISYHNHAGYQYLISPTLTVGLKDGDTISTGWYILSGNTATNHFNVTTGGVTTKAYRKLLLTFSGSAVTGYTVLGYYKDPECTVPDDGTSEALMNKYANFEDGYSVIGSTCGQGTSYIKVSYSNSTLTLSPFNTGSCPVTISAVGSYYISPSNYAWCLFTVLKYKNLAPQLQKSSENAYNGKNYIFYAKDFFVEPSSSTTYISTTVTGHDSVRYESGLKAYLVNLGTNPVNSNTYAVYKLKATNGYGSYEAEITFHLYPSSLVIEAQSGGNTDPSPGLVGGEPGDGVTVTCTPDETHEFVKWTGSAATVANEKDNPINVVLTSEQLTLKPEYKEIPYVERFDLLLSFNPQKGTIKVNNQEITESTSLRLEKGTLVKIQATPKAGYEFTSWDGDMSAAFKTDSYVEFYLNETKNIAGIFSKIAAGSGNSGTATIGTGGNPSNNVITFDKATLDALLKNNSNNSNIGTRTGSTSFTANPPFGSANSHFSSTNMPSSPDRSYSSNYNIFGDRGDGASSALKSGGNQGGNVHDIQQLKNNKGYYFKYKAYEGDAFSGVEGMQIYYSTDEVEQYRNTGGIPPITIISSLMNLIQGK